MQDEKSYKIAEIAAATGMAAETLRQWEKHGLLEPSRAPSGHRLYGEAQLATAQAIARLRTQEGMGLSEIKAALRASQPVKHRTGRKVVEAGPVSAPGQRLRRLRSGRGVSLSQLATSVGIVPSALSTFERTSQGLGVSVLRRVADFFDVTVTQLTVEPEQNGKPIRRSKGKRISTLGKGIKVRALATGPRSMDCKEWTLKPGAKSDGFYNHAGEEFVFVMSGRFDITVEGLGHFRLSGGDSLYFESTRPHAWANEDGEPCVVLWINTPPSF